MKPKVFVTRIIPDQGLKLVLEHCDAEVWQDELPPPRAVLLEKVRDLDGLLSLLTEKVDAELLDQAPKLKVVSNMAVGFDNIVVPECTKRGIPVGNTPGVLTDTTADFAFTLLMAAARRVVEGHEWVKAGRWKTWGPMLLLGQDVHGATLGLIGFGRIGRAMARRAQGFGMRILFYDIVPCIEGVEEYKAECCDFDTVLRESDFVSLHTPLTRETYHLIGDREFDLMKPTAILINSARGPIVDPKALYRALKEGKIAYAALDVTEPEPIPMDDPLLTLPNCLIVPHIASASVKTRGKMAQMAAENLLAGLRGERLPNCVNPEIYA
jgi:glyoxylate reductase